MFIFFCFISLVLFSRVKNFNSSNADGRFAQINLTIRRDRRCVINNSVMSCNSSLMTLLSPAYRRKNSREIKAVYDRNKCPAVTNQPPTTTAKLLRAQASLIIPNAGYDLCRTLVILYISSLSSSRMYNLVVYPVTKGAFTTHSWLHLHHR